MLVATSLLIVPVLFDTLALFRTHKQKFPFALRDALSCRLVLRSTAARDGNCDAKPRRLAPVLRFCPAKAVGWSPGVQREAILCRALRIPVTLPRHLRSRASLWLRRLPPRSARLLFRSLRPLLVQVLGDRPKMVAGRSVCLLSLWRASRLGICRCWGFFGLLFGQLSHLHCCHTTTAFLLIYMKSSVRLHSLSTCSRGSPSRRPAALTTFLDGRFRPAPHFGDRSPGFYLCNRDQYTTSSLPKRWLASSESYS